MSLSLIYYYTMFFDGSLGYMEDEQKNRFKDNPENVCKVNEVILKYLE